MNNEAFSEIVHLLISGEVIDNLCFTLHYQRLLDNVFFDEMNDFLHRIDRKCVKTHDGYGFYVVYLNIQQRKVQHSIESHFNAFVSKIEPLVEWVRLCRSLHSESKPLAYNDIITKGHLLSAIEQSEYLQSRLKEIIKKLGRSNTASSSQEHLESVLKYLTAENYLFNTGSDTGSVYVATAKWSLFYEQLEYIAACEQIKSDSDSQLKQDALL